ncbi:MAG: hypothetical protein NT178_18100 [Proteobacteria bacterium]|nr:hypothetical protein [Pseudomonadota bacterium]
MLGEVGSKPWLHDNLSDAGWLEDIVCVHWSLRSPMDGRIYEIDEEKIVTYAATSGVDVKQE